MRLFRVDNFTLNRCQIIQKWRKYNAGSQCTTVSGKNEIQMFYPVCGYVKTNDHHTGD